MNKKIYYYMGLGLIILIFGIFALTEISRRVENKEVTDVDRHQVGKKKAEMMTIGKAPKFSFTDQHGNIISNATFKDKVYVLDFIFTTCPSICPIMTKNMVTVQNAFNNKPIGIVSITINPENDTPEVLKAYAEEYGVTNPDWHFLTGDKETIYKLANEGFNLYAGQGDQFEGGFEHSGMFALIDKDGNIVCRKDNFGNPIVYYDGIEPEGIEMLISDIQQLLKN